jgi:hypothetical protein
MRGGLVAGPRCAVWRPPSLPGRRRASRAVAGLECRRRASLAVAEPRRPSPGWSAAAEPRGPSPGWSAAAGPRCAVWRPPSLPGRRRPSPGLDALSGARRAPLAAAGFRRGCRRRAAAGLPAEAGTHHGYSTPASAASAAKCRGCGVSRPARTSIAAGRVQSIVRRISAGRLV